MAINHAAGYAKGVDEVWTKASHSAKYFKNNRYKFTGKRTVKVYSIPTVPINDYQRSGSLRFGQLQDLQDSVQELTLGMDKAFTFVIDRGDRNETEMVHDAGTALARQIKGPVTDLFDHYAFSRIAKAAVTAGNFDNTVPAITSGVNNAYELFLNAQEHLWDNDVPDEGRICFCSYAFANLIKRCPEFVQASDTAQKGLINGTIFGVVDGVKMVRVNKKRFTYHETVTTSGSGENATTTTTLSDYGSFLLVHPSAIVMPKALTEYRTHKDPLGISGWVVEGRVIFDTFVMEQKLGGIFYQGKNNLTVPARRGGANWTADAA